MMTIMQLPQTPDLGVVVVVDLALCRDLIDGSKGG